MYLRPHLYTGKIVVHLGSGHIGSPDRDMCLIGGDQMHVPVQSRTGIPARLLVHVLQADSQGIVFPVAVDQSGDIEVEGVVAVGPEARLLAVHEYTGVAHGTIELDKGTALFRETGHVERSPVPPHPGEGKPAGTTVMLDGGGLSVLHDRHAVDIVLLVERTVDGPVVGHTYRLPAAVVKRRFRCMRVVRPRELPPFFEGDLRPALSPRKSQPGHQHDANQYRFLHDANFLSNILITLY